jgi:hypothetical protein
LEKFSCIGLHEGDTAEGLVVLVSEWPTASSRR